MVWSYLVCMLYMLGSGAANNNYILLTEPVRTEADSQYRLSTINSELGHTNVRLPQTSYRIATSEGSTGFM